MKICFMCDLHLPFDKNALQYDVLSWAIADVSKKRPDCIAFVGDVTCDGNESVYDNFVERMENTGITFLYIPGNSDLRDNESENSIYKKTSPCKNTVNGVDIYAVNDSNRGISDEQMAILESADGKSIVFMHHPPQNHDKATVAKLTEWRAAHPDTVIFYGHRHISLNEGTEICLQAMDPDKSIGESPCITYFDTETGELRKSYYFAPVPTDLYGFMGISCYDPIGQIDFAIQNGLKCIELRPNCVKADRESLKNAVERWRAAGGENLSIHLPDVAWRDGEVTTKVEYDILVELISALNADRVTQHVPKVSVREIKENSQALDNICRFIADKLNSVEHSIVVGVENMHMTAADTADDSRRFGYIPEECILFMDTLAGVCRHRVGINFDIGHARNNAPYSQKYQISTWFSMLGEHIVGYHIHQVYEKNGVYENHMEIADIYGRLISYASFFKCWSSERIRKAPVIFEMRPSNAYEITLDTFRKYREKNIFDLHSHTYYSNCGRDDPHALIKTAIENGVALLGITDHNYGIGDRKQAYIGDVRALAEQYRDRIKIVCGIEIATLPGFYDIKSPEEIKDFDYCLIEHITYDDSFVKGNIFELCKEFGILCGIAHTDLFAYCDKFGFDYVDFFKKMAENNIFWEMNVSFDSIHKYREHKYVLDFMNDEEKQRIVREAGVYVSVGFDSHRCEDYDGNKVHQMYDFLKQKGIKTADEMILASIKERFF